MLMKPEKANSHDCVKGTPLLSFASESLAIIVHLKLVETKEITMQLLKIINILSAIKQQDFASPCKNSNLMASKMAEAE